MDKEPKCYKCKNSAKMFNKCLCTIGKHLPSCQNDTPGYDIKEKYQTVTDKT